MKRYYYILTILFFAVINVGLAGIKEQAEEGIYTMTNKGYQLDMQTMVYKDSVYLPLLGFINSMEISNTYDPVNKSVSGYLFSKDSTYYFSLSERKIVCTNGKERIFGESEAFMGEGEIYVLSSIITDLFNCTIKISTLRLTILLEAPYQFPFLVKALREKKYAKMSSEEVPSGSEFYPELYGRNWKILDGGILDYTLNMSQSGSSNSSASRNYGFSNNIGLQLLGGEFQMNSGGSYAETTKDFNWNKRFRWGYSIGENSWLTHISAGDISPASARGMGGLTTTTPVGALQGVQFSNEQMRMPTVFENIRIEDKIEPDWTVELYSNNQFIEYRKTDNTGYYLFELPIRYGNTDVELKFYGPKGEFYNKTKIISVSSEFLRFGETKYSISAGKTINDKYLGVADLTMGLTPWLTGSVNFVKGYKTRTYDISARSSLNLFNLITLNTFYLPNQVVQNSTRFTIPGLGSYDISYSLYDKTLSGSGRAPLDVTEFSGGLPHISFIPGNISFRAVRTNYTNAINYAISASSYLNFWGLTFSNNYQATYAQSKNTELSSNNSLNHSLNSSMDYSWYTKPKFLEWIGNTRFQISAQTDLNEKKVRSINGGIQQTLSRDLNMAISYSKDLSSENSSSMNLSLNMNLPAFRMNTSGNYSSGNSYGINNDLSGTMGFDSRNLDVFFSNNIGSSSGAGAANVRFFIDANDNSLFDKGEEIITGVDINVPNATIDRDKESQSRKVYNLQPGGRYNFSVRKESFKNPNWVPKQTEFSFVADPNTYKNIDIPCYVAGVIEGSVFKNDGKDKSGQSGVRVHIRKKDGSYNESIPVYSDGSFYKMGVPPGDYDAWVDTTQCNILEVTPDTKVLAFNVKTTADGDMVSGLNFELRTKEFYAKMNKISKELNAAKLNDAKIASTASDLTLNNSKIEAPFAENSNTNINPIAVLDIPEETNSEAATKVTDNLSEMISGKSLKFASVSNFAVSADNGKYLDKLANYMKEHQEYSVAVVGHTDSGGDINSNLQTSKKRAQAIANYLTANGISPKRILVKGEGALYPVASNATPEGRKQNRRVEVKLIK